MERELQQKQVDWSTVVEFFTKRGRPLSKDEIAKLIDEDRREREVNEARERANEEAERRRNQRIMGDIEEEEEQYEAVEQSRPATAQKLEEGSEGDIERAEYDEEYDEEDLERGEAEEGDFDGNRTTGETALGENLSRTKLTQ